MTALDPQLGLRVYARLETAASARLLCDWDDGHVRCSLTPEEFRAAIGPDRRDSQDPGDE